MVKFLFEKDVVVGRFYRLHYSSPSADLYKIIKVDPLENAIYVVYMGDGMRCITIHPYNPERGWYYSQKDNFKFGR